MEQRCPPCIRPPGDLPRTPLECSHFEVGGLVFFKGLDLFMQLKLNDLPHHIVLVPTLKLSYEQALGSPER